MGPVFGSTSGQPMIRNPPLAPERRQTYNNLFRGTTHADEKIVLIFAPYRENPTLLASSSDGEAVEEWRSLHH